MPVRYAVNVENGHDQRRGRMPMRATRRGYIDAFVEVRIDPLFLAGWEARFKSTWPTVRTALGFEVHPALVRLVDNTAVDAMAIMDHNRSRRGYWLARRTRMAAEFDLRVDRRGRVRGGDESSDEV